MALATGHPTPFAEHLPCTQGLRFSCKSSKYPTGKKGVHAFPHSPPPDNFQENFTQSEDCRDGGLVNVENMAYRHHIGVDGGLKNLMEVVRTNLCVRDLKWCDSPCLNVNHPVLIL